MTRPATAGDLMRVLASVPPDAELHVYVRGTTASVQAEWVDSDQHIQNPVVLRAACELWGAAGAEVPQYAAPDLRDWSPKGHRWNAPDMGHPIGWCLDHERWENEDGDPHFAASAPVMDGEQ